jgi:hypothetical protein
MKNILIAVFLGTTLIFGALYMSELKKNHDAKTASIALEEKVTKLQSTVDSQDRRTTMLKQELDKARTETSAKVQKAVRQSKKGQGDDTAGTDSTVGGKMGKAMAGMAEEMSKNPELKEVIKAQQKIALSAMIDKNYAKLFSQMGLTAEQSATLKDLMTTKALASAEAGLSMFGSDMDASKRADLVKQIRASTDEADAKIKEYLGDSKYSDYQNYEKTLAQRMAVSGFKDQVASGANAISEAQEEELMKALSQEHANFKFTTDFSDKSKMDPANFASTFTEEKINTYMQELDQLKSQYITRAQSILTADQLTAFQKYMDGQYALQKAGMQMAVKMFGDKPAK